MPVPDAELRSAIDRTRELVTDTRRLLHRRPELSHAEHETAGHAAALAEEMGFTVRPGVGGTGVVAEIEGASPGPTVLLRADMDALPITERAHPGALVSEHAGVMHACGHDGHVAMLLGAGAVLAGLRDSWPGRVRLVFQPAEEVAGGAAPMIDAGAADGADWAFGIHLWSLIPAGRVAVTPGPVFGSADEVTLTVRGRGGHGGMPHLSVDPVLVAAHVITALQALVSRETSPFDPAVVTIGRIEGGTTFNVIAEEVHLRGTVRALSTATRERLIERIGQVAAGVASGLGAEAVMGRGNGTPPVVSSAEGAERVRRAAVATVGDDHVDIAHPITVGDDMALFLERVPGCYFLVGAGDPDAGTVAPHHHPEFRIDEGCLPVGVEALVRTALSVLA